jgi:cobalt/nickel transport system permease protein
VHIHFLDPYQSGSSLIHNTDARVKLILVLAFIIATALIPVGAWAIFALLLVIVLASEFLSGIGLGYFLKRATLALPFILAALPLVFTIPGIPLFGFTIGPWDFSASSLGLERFASIALKSWISIQMAVLLTATTPFPDILVGMRSLKIPRLLVAIFGLMWRYLFVFADEGLRLLRARAARSGVSENPGLRSGGTISWRAQTTGGMAGNLFVRSIERSDRIYAAMLARGYDGEIRSLPQMKMQSFNWAVLFLGGVTIGLVLALSILVGN